jgi:hypothetical protein
MADVTTEHLLRYAIHDSTSQRLSEPSASKVCVIPAEPTLFRPSPEYTTIDRSGRVLPNGEHVPNARGIFNREIGAVSFEVEGLSAGGAGDGDDASTLSSTVWPIIEQLAGGTDSGTGDTTDGSDAGSGTSVEADGSVEVNRGSAMLIKGATSGAYQARMVSQSTGSTYSIERALTDDTGTADTADEDEVLYASRTAYFDNALTERSHIAWFSEHDNNAREYLGCMPSGASLSMGAGEIMLLNLEGIACSKVNTTLTSGAGSYSAPTTGSKIVCAPMILHIGSTRFVASNFGFNFGLRRMTVGGPGPLNVLGYSIGSAQPVLTCRISYGTLTAPQELTQALRESHEGANSYSVNTVDVSLQIGDQPGAAMLIHMPAARATYADAQEDGMHVVDATFTASESGVSLLPGGASLSIF